MKFGSVDKIRTVSDSKRDFYTRHTRPINSVYRRVVEELLVEMHLLSVNVDFHYDPIYALGVVTSFEKFMEGYRPGEDKPNIFNALCQAVNGNPEVYRRDAENMIAIAKETNIDSLLSQLQNPALGGNNQLSDSLVSVINAPKFKYSRLFAIGLYTILAEAQPDMIKENESFCTFLEEFARDMEEIRKDLLDETRLEMEQLKFEILEEKKKTKTAARKKRMKRIQ